MKVLASAVSAITAILATKYNINDDGIAKFVAGFVFGLI